MTTTAVLDGHYLTGRRGDGVNAYLYRRNDSGELVLDSKLETVAPGGNRVVVAIEIRVLADTNIHDALGMAEARVENPLALIEGAEVDFVGDQRQKAALVEILAGFRELIGIWHAGEAPLVFERSAVGDEFRYVLTEESRTRLRAMAPDAQANPVTIGSNVRAAFELTHGSFEAHLGLVALAGIDRKGLARIGGYEVRADGEVVHRWPETE